MTAIEKYTSEQSVKIEPKIKASVQINTIRGKKNDRKIEKKEGYLYYYAGKAYNGNRLFLFTYEEYGEKINTIVNEKNIVKV